MHKLLSKLLNRMLLNRIIGEKHVPEDLMIIKLIKHENKYSRKQFMDEYERLVRKGFMIRLKKRTGQKDDWHISLNPELIQEIHELVGEINEV